MLIQSHKILIVEDSPHDRATFRRYLGKDSKNSYTFWEVETGEKGLESFRVRPPDCILLDYSLPDMDGLEFLNELKNRTNGNHPAVPVVMLTGYGDEKIAVQAMKSGVADYLVKGDLYPEALQWAIANALEKAKLQRKLDEQQQELERQSQELARKNQELENLTERLSGILESITDGFFALDNEGCFTYFNQKALQLLDKTSEEVFGKNSREILLKALGEAFCQELRNAIIPTIGSEFEVFIPKLKGWLTVRVYPAQNGHTVYLCDIKPNILKRYQLLSENTLDITLFIRPDGTILEANRAAALAYGYSIEELQSLNIRALRAPETLYLVDTQMQQANSKGIILETLHLRKDGNTFPVEITSYGIELDNEQVLLSVIRDISERKAAEKVLRESEERYRLLAEYSTDIIFKDAPGGRILYVSPACRTVLGYEPAEMEGRAVFEFLHPDDLEELKKGLPKTSIYSDIATQIATQFRRKDGSYIWLETSYRIIRDPETNRPPYSVGVSRDITFRKQSEEILRKWSSVFEHAQWGIAIANPTSDTFDLVNPAFARMHGYEVAELVGKPISQAFAPQVRSGLPAKFQFINEQGHDLFESIHLRKDGSTFPTITDVTAVKDELGKVLYRVANVQDITWIKRVEEQLRTSEQLHRTLVENSPDVICRIDRELNYAYINQAVGQATSITVSDYIGHTVRELGFPLDFCEEWETNMQEVFRSGQELIVEYSLLLRKGLAYYQTRLVPEFSPDGAVESILAISRDISILKQAQLALQTSEARLQAILNNAPLAIYLRDLEGRYLFVNQWVKNRAESGENKLEGQSVYELFQKRHGDEWLENDRKVLEAG
ncbi:MAG: PAS domain S-box protein, partial [Chloroflexota bacterium]